MSENRKHYGIFSQNSASTETELAYEEVERLGYNIKEGVISKTCCKSLLRWAISANEARKTRYGVENLQTIGELNQVRLPLVENKLYFEKILLNPWVNSLLDLAFRETRSFFTLNQQNIILNQNNSAHNQSSWHRDLPYVHGVKNAPDAYSFLVALSDFTLKNGGTVVVPGTHKTSQMPSWEYIEANQKQIECSAGSVIFFNSFLLHKAGINTSGDLRVAVNNVFTTPAYQQQISIPKALNLAQSDWFQNLEKEHKQLLGFHSQPFESEQELITSKLRRQKLSF